MDSPFLGYADTERALRDLDRVHRVMRVGPMWRVVARQLGDLTRAQVLDVGTGSGTVVRKFAAIASAEGLSLATTGLDRKLTHLMVGQTWGVCSPSAVGLATTLPFADRSFDVALSTLLFHHFDAPENEAILREMVRVSRRAAIVFDLQRSWLNRLGARLLLPLLGLGPVARFDGRVSADNAWVPESALRIGHRVGHAKLVEVDCFRFALVLPRDDL